MLSKSSFGLLFLLSLALVLGCGTSKTPARLSGKVTYKDAPVKGGTINLYPKEGGYTIDINSDGTYDKAGLPSGDVDVTIETESIKPRELPKYGGGKGGKDMTSPPPPGAGGGAPKGEYVKIPEKYAKKETSGLKVTLQPGANTKDFPLTD